MFDLLPSQPGPSGDGPAAEKAAAKAAAEADGLASTFASLLRTPDSKLFIGDIMRQANATAGLRRLLPFADGGSAYKVVTVRARGEGVASSQSKSGSWTTGFVFAAAAVVLLGVGTLASRQRRGSQPYGYGLPGDEARMPAGGTYVIDEEEEELVQVAPDEMNLSSRMPPVRQGLEVEPSDGRQVEYF